MKYRTGFVSNSSSSSFVAVFLRAPTLDELTQAYYDLWDQSVIESLDNDEFETLKSATPDKQKEMIIDHLERAEDDNDDCENHCTLKGCLDEVMGKDCHTLGSFETGPDGGGSVYLTANEVRKILGDEPKNDDPWPSNKDALAKAAEKIIPDL
jgi:hypothetical protein